MAFQTDDTWTPSAYRKAYVLWAANAPKTDGSIMPRDADTESPRHGKLSGKLRGLLAWRAATQPEPPLVTSWLRYDLKPDNDNTFEEEEYVPQLLDSAYEIQPSIAQLRAEWLGKDEKPIGYSRGVAVSGDIAHGMQKDVPEYVASEAEGARAPRRDCRVVTRVGRLEFGNGEQEERCVILRLDKPVMGRVRVPAGALVRYKGHKPVDNFRAAKGSLPETEATVGVGGHNPGVGICPDPLVDHEWAITLRAAVGQETAKVLDLAVRAANFREVGEAFGKQGKNAERYGKRVVLDACEKLDTILAANDNWPSRMAA